MSTITEQFARLLPLTDPVAMGVVSSFAASLQPAPAQGDLPEVTQDDCAALFAAVVDKLIAEGLGNRNGRVTEADVQRVLQAYRAPADAA